MNLRLRDHLHGLLVSRILKETTIRIVFQYRGASGYLELQDPGYCALSNVWSQSRNQGEATKLMELITAYADLQGLTITLIAQRYGSPNNKGLDNKGLVEFYEKFGFEKTGGKPPFVMVRNSSRKKHGI